MKVQVRYRTDNNQPFFFDLHTNKEVPIYQVQDALNKLIENSDEKLVAELSMNYFQQWSYKTDFSR